MSSKTWSQYFGIDAASKAERQASKAALEEKKHAEAVEELRQRLLNSEEGRLCAKQLAETGEWGRDGTPDMLTTDAFLRRWLVARDWHVDVTYKLLVHHGGWRAHVLGTQGYIPEEAVAKPLRDNTIFLQGRDRQGRGLIIVKVANHHSRGRDLRQMKLFSVYIMEAMVALCDKERNPTCRLSSMFDLTGCGYSNMDAAVMRNILGILSTHYVERLSVMYFYNPPSLFWGIWNASKHLLPEVTRQKIRMIDPSDVTELREWLEPDVLPKEYGGEGELLPIAVACRRFKLPPFDGREDPTKGPGADMRPGMKERLGAPPPPASAAEEEAAAAAEAEAAAAAAEAAGAAVGDDAELLVEDGGAPAAGGKAAAAAGGAADVVASAATARA